MRKLLPFFQRIHWQTLRTIWISLKASEILPFLFIFTKERFRLQRSDFWKEWKRNHFNRSHLKYPLEMIAFYNSYKQVTNTERTVIIVIKILKNQSSEVFIEMIDLFSKYGIKII